MQDDPMSSVFDLFVVNYGYQVLDFKRSRKHETQLIVYKFQDINYIPKRQH